MTVRTLKLDNFDIHVLSNKVDKTDTIKITFLNNYKSYEDFLYKIVLLSILIRESKKYNTYMDMVFKKEDLYNVSIFPNNSRVENKIKYGLTLKFIKNKYTSNKLFKDVVELLKEILLNPKVESNCFDEKLVEFVKSNMISFYKDLKNNYLSYAIGEVSKILREENNYKYGFSIDEIIKLLENITPHIMYEKYLDLINNSKIDIFINSEYRLNELKQIFNSFNLKSTNIEKNVSDDQIITNHFVERRKEINANQSTIIMNFKINNQTEFEKKYVSTLYSYIMSHLPDSKLFMGIREKKSLCYMIGMESNPFDNVYYIYSQINKNNYNVFVEEVKNIINNFSIDDNMLKRSKNMYIDSKKTKNNNKIMDMFISQTLFDMDSNDKIIENIDKVTKYDLIKFNKKIEFNTIYFLEGIDA